MLRQHMVGMREHVPESSYSSACVSDAAAVGRAAAQEPGQGHIDMKLDTDQKDPEHDLVSHVILVPSIFKTA